MTQAGGYRRVDALSMDELPFPASRTEGEGCVGAAPSPCCALGSTAKATWSAQADHMENFLKGCQLPADTGWDYIYFATQEEVPSSVRGSVITLGREIVQVFFGPWLPNVSF